jgi:hypothetical protein
LTLLADFTGLASDAATTTVLGIAFCIHTDPGTKSRTGTTADTASFFTHLTGFARQAALPTVTRVVF